jgi:hypothetical protein
LQMPFVVLVGGAALNGRDRRRNPARTDPARTASSLAAPGWGPPPRATLLPVRFLPRFRLGGGHNYKFRSPRYDVKPVEKGNKLAAGLSKHPRAEAYPFASGANAGGNG